MSSVEELVGRVEQENPEKVLLQVPEGLKPKLQEVQSKLEERGIESVGSLEPCYGACDIKDLEAEQLGCDLLVHVGHSKFCREEEVETLYFPWYYDLDPSAILENELSKLDDYKNIGLISSINFKKALKKAKNKLESLGKNIFIKEGDRTEKGQILGCDISSALKVLDRVDCFLYIGSGEFHPLGLALKTGKPIFMVDFENETLKELGFDKFKKQRHAAVGRVGGSKKFGILLSTKKGQRNPQLAAEIKDKLEGENLKAWIFSMDEILPEKLQGLKVDCWVNTACPRIAVERRTEFGKPILNLDELDEVL